MILISVDFPAPFSPSSAWIEPRASLIDTSESAFTPGNDLLTLLARRTSSVVTRSS
jgi:hypothetical protein